MATKRGTAMWSSARQAVGRLSLAQRFMLGSLAILLIGMAGVGAWVSRQIEQGVINQTAANTALYVDSLVGRSVQNLEADDQLSAEGIDRLDWLFEDTPLGQEVALFRIWDSDGNIVYSFPSSPPTDQFPVEGELAEAFAGRVSADIGDLEGEQELSADVQDSDLLEIYSPLRSVGSDDVIAVAEFYYSTRDLKRDIASAQRRSWLVVGGAAIIIYLLLAVFVQRASDTIERQQRELASNVHRLTDLLGQNQRLHERVRIAAARTTALNERFLRRLSAELHDGPAQDISLALLQLDHVQARYAAGDTSTAANEATLRDLDVINASLRRALHEVRGTSSGLLLPQLTDLSVGQTVEHVVRVHQRRTGSKIAVNQGELPEHAPLSTKIALYRIIQEGLANAWRHASGAEQAVSVARVDGHLRAEVVDRGPGFDPATIDRSESHLGLVGMRERAESLGGEFRIESAAGHGTRVIAMLPLRPTGEG
jgi:signal transduction histidine kinase